MSLFIILVTLFIERFTNAIENLRNFAWLDRYTALVRGRCEGFGLGSTPTLVIAVAIPLVVLVILMQLIGGILGGLVGVLIALAVLLFSIGPRNLSKEVDAFLEAGAMKDEEREMKHARNLLGDQVPDDAAERARAVLQRMLIGSNSSLFAVLFWFVVLGPVGALLYRLANLMRAPEGAEPDGFQQTATQLQGLLDWIPARLVALFYALTGSFDRSFPVLRTGVLGSWGNMAAENEALLRDAGCEAIQLSEEELKEPLQARSAVERASSLVFRSLIAFVAILALLTIVGLSS
ncbi:regulatory signaling modulator protein AmpE [Ectothiorhodospira lacustris]|uniref:regulatory signaling modulator protein AmpE n=1 Tax=Ectothiorhodospira lacustris TaxID=2899127 RepID=UPI001EE956ED|nr:regulatory signaling modulator protein AmpE [Ectothiorhodospira lacustris]MCG5500741.1 regulatory signaling modulator protein AmpE [Ectothiorhodospira lacustris]MCG5510877.1 regulatory signaling modulator protein AmpE [Ectothiorhodospira lacustris]MCG5522577.1 regulatory signaling modulator protein AmpE [Ectothiorhodospira lacustris]